MYLTKQSEDYLPKTLISHGGKLAEAFSDWLTISAVAHTVAMGNDINIKNLNQRKP